MSSDLVIAKHNAEVFSITESGRIEKCGYGLFGGEPYFLKEHKDYPGYYKFESNFTITPKSHFVRVNAAPRTSEHVYGVYEKVYRYPSGPLSYKSIYTPDYVFGMCVECDGVEYLECPAIGWIKLGRFDFVRMI